MKKINLIVVALIAIVLLPACRPSLWKKGVKVAEEIGVTAKKNTPKVIESIKVGEEAAQKAKNLAGKEIKLSEKYYYTLQYGDDVMKHVEFQTQTCPLCSGSGRDEYGNTCSRCDGDKYVYKLKFK